MKYLLTLIFFLLSIANAQEVNLNTIVNKAKEENRHIVVFFHRPYCGYCSKMIRDTLGADSVSVKIKKDFIYVDIDIKDTGLLIFNNFKGSRREFARYLDYNVYPSTIFIDKNGEMIYAQAGYQNEEEFSKILSYVHSNAYEDMGIEEFKEEK